MTPDERLREAVKMKFCKDCKHCSIQIYWCEHPKIAIPSRPDLVTGRRSTLLVECAEARKERVHETGPVCGPSGDLWEPRPKPWWRFW